MILNKVEVRPNKPKDGRHCDLCGCSQPAVRCDKCGCQIFCLSCDDMYHRHPKRRFHLRKAVDPTPSTAQARPVLPIKVAHLPTSPGDPSKMPLPPPRKKKPSKSFFGTFRRGSPSSDNSPPLPKKEYSWTDRLGSIKKFMSNRPLPPLPNNNSEDNHIDISGQLRSHNLSFIHKKVDEKPPELPQRTYKPQESFGDRDENENRFQGRNGTEMRNGTLQIQRNGDFASIDEQWSQNIRENQMHQRFNTLDNRNHPGFIHQGRSPYPTGYPQNMHQSASATDLQSLPGMDVFPGPGMPPHYPPYPMNAAMPQHYPYPVYPQYPNYPPYFGNSFANISNPQTTDGDFSDHSETSLRHQLGKRLPFRKRAKRSQSVMMDRMGYPGQFYPFGPYPPGYAPPPWGPPFPMDAPPSPASSIRSLNRIGKTRRRKKVTSEEEDEEFSLSSSPLSRPKSSSSDRPIQSLRKVPFAPQSSSSDESEDERDSNWNKGGKNSRKNSDSRRISSPATQSPKVIKIKSSKIKKRDSPHYSDDEEQQINQTKIGKSQLKESATDKKELTLSASSTTSSSEWHCKHCTFLNPSVNKICQVCCKTASPVDEAPVLSSSPAPSGSRKQSVSSEKSCSTPDRKVVDKSEDDLINKNDKRDMDNLNSALDEAEKEINRGIEELLKLKEDFSTQPHSTSKKEKPPIQKPPAGKDTAESSKPVYKSSGKLRSSILDKLSFSASEPSTKSTTTETQTGTNLDQSIQMTDRIIEARRPSTSSTSDAYNSPIAQSPELGQTPTVKDKNGKSAPKRDSSCQTYQDIPMDFTEGKRMDEDPFRRPSNGYGYRYGDRRDLVTSPTPSMYDRGFGGGFGMMPRSHSRASLFTGRINDTGPLEYGLGPSPMFRSVSRTSLTGDFSENRLSDFHNMRKPDYYLSMEELVERRRQEHIKAQGLELVRIIREAEQQGFTADDIQVALSKCGKQNPLEWLQENWDKMVENVINLTTNYGNEKKENDVGAVSEGEAREALRMHKGNIWAAVTECVESRQRKFFELSARGKFRPAAITEALTAAQGDVGIAYEKLSKSSSKPFLMRIWGAGAGADNQDGAVMPSTSSKYSEKEEFYKRQASREYDVLSDEVWSEDEDVEWGDDVEEEDDPEQGDLDDLQTCRDDFAMEALATESDKSDYCDAFGSNSLDRTARLPLEEEVSTLFDFQKEKKRNSFLNKIAALRRDEKRVNGKSGEGDMIKNGTESDHADINVKQEQQKSYAPLNIIKNTISAIRDTVSGPLKSEKKSPCIAPERRTIVVGDKITEINYTQPQSQEPVVLKSIKFTSESSTDMVKTNKQTEKSYTLSDKLPEKNSSEQIIPKELSEKAVGTLASKDEKSPLLSKDMRNKMESNVSSTAEKPLDSEKEQAQKISNTSVVPKNTVVSDKAVTDTHQNENYDFGNKMFNSGHRKDSTLNESQIDVLNEKEKTKEFDDDSLLSAKKPMPDVVTNVKNNNTSHEFPTTEIQSSYSYPMNDAFQKREILDATHGKRTKEILPSKECPTVNSVMDPKTVLHAERNENSSIKVCFEQKRDDPIDLLENLKTSLVGTSNTTEQIENIKYIDSGENEEEIANTEPSLDEVTKNNLGVEGIESDLCLTKQNSEVIKTDNLKENNLDDHNLDQIAEFINVDEKNNFVYKDEIKNSSITDDKSKSIYQNELNTDFSETTNELDLSIEKRASTADASRVTSNSNSDKCNSVADTECQPADGDCSNIVFITSEDHKENSVVLESEPGVSLSPILKSSLGDTASFENRTNESEIKTNSMLNEEVKISKSASKHSSEPSTSKIEEISNLQEISDIASTLHTSTESPISDANLQEKLVENNEVVEESPSSTSAVSSENIPSLSKENGATTDGFQNKNKVVNSNSTENVSILIGLKHSNAEKIQSPIPKEISRDNEKKENLLETVTNSKRNISKSPADSLLVSNDGLKTTVQDSNAKTQKDLDRKTTQLRPKHKQNKISDFETASNFPNLEKKFISDSTIKTNSNLSSKNSLTKTQTSVKTETADKSTDNLSFTLQSKEELENVDKRDITSGEKSSIGSSLSFNETSEGILQSKESENNLQRHGNKKKYDEEIKHSSENINNEKQFDETVPSQTIPTSYPLPETSDDKFNEIKNLNASDIPKIEDSSSESKSEIFAASQISQSKDEYTSNKLNSPEDNLTSRASTSTTLEQVSIKKEPSAFKKGASKTHGILKKTPSTESHSSNKVSFSSDGAEILDDQKTQTSERVDSSTSSQDVPEDHDQIEDLSSSSDMSSGSSRQNSVTPPSPVDTLRSRLEGLIDGGTTVVRPHSPMRRMSFNSRKAAIALERTRDPSSDKSWMNQMTKTEPTKPVIKRTLKQQLEIERRVRKMVADRKCRTYKKAEIVIQLMDMNFTEEEAIQAANECSTLDQAISYLQQECFLCTGYFPVSQIISMVHCPHKACRECIRAYFTVQIRDRNIMELLCPFCNEPDLTDEDIAQDYFNHLDIMLKKLVDEEIHELFQRKLRDRVLMRDPCFRWCSKCSSGFIAMPNLKRLVCPDCNAVTCASCRRPWEREHQGISCEAFAAWKDATDPEAQTLGLAKLLTENGIDCPRCHFRYALAKGGCMHFRCIQCQHDFCSGCSRPFKMGQKCGVSEFCAKLGLHAHHPRNCLFYLRDKDPDDLQRLLDMNDIKYNRDPPEGMEIKNTCQVMEQKETADGMVDDYCGKDVEKGFAGLCRIHYVEYLGQLVNKHKVDPIQIFENDDLELVLRRANIRLPSKRYREPDSSYREKLINLIQEELSLEKTEGT